jgi:hypothetical protein
MWMAEIRLSLPTTAGKYLQQEFGEELVEYAERLCHLPVVPTNTAKCSEV